MQEDYSNVKVGDTVWYGSVNRRGIVETKVSKVGTKLITTQEDHWRPVVFRKDTGRTNDEYGHQFLIVDLERYEAENKANAAWNLLRGGMMHRPDSVTYANIVAASNLLGVNIDIMGVVK